MSLLPSVCLHLIIAVLHVPILHKLEMPGSDGCKDIPSPHRNTILQAKHEWPDNSRVVTWVVTWVGLPIFLSSVKGILT